MKNTLFYVFASLLPVISNFLLLPLYTHYITPQDYGILGLILMFQSVMPVILAFQLQNAISRFYFDYQGFELKIFISTLFFAIVTLDIITVSVILINLPTIIDLMLPGLNGNLFGFYLATISGAISILSTFQLLLLTVKKEAKKIALISFFTTLFNIMTNLIFVVVLKRSYLGILEAGLINVTVLFFVLFLANRKNYTLVFNFKWLKAPLSYSVPLIPHALSGIIFMYSDRLILEKSVSLFLIGIYVFADKLASLVKLGVNQLNSAYSPFFIEEAKKDKLSAAKQAREMSKIIVYILLLGLLIITLFAPEIIYTFFDKKYFDSWKILPILAAAYIFRSLYIFTSSGIFFEKKTGRITLITLIAAVFNLIINIIFIPKWGIWTAAISTIISFFLTYVLAVFFSKKIYDINLDTKFNFVMISYLFTIIIVSYFLNSPFSIVNPFLPGIVYLIKICLLVIALFLGYYFKMYNLGKIKLLWNRFI